MEEQSLKDKLIEEVILAETEEQAANAIKSVMSALHINKDYQAMYRLGEDLKKSAKGISELQHKHYNLPTPRDKSIVQEMRIEANFLFRDIVDNFVKPIDSLKIIVENNKKEMEFEAYKYIDDNPKDFDGVTKSNKREFLGGTPMYKEWSQLNAISHSNYAYLAKILESTKLFIDSLASDLRALDVVEKQNIR